MRRREFIKVIAGSTAAWPLAAFAQQSERMRRIGVLVGGGLDADDSDMQVRIGAFEDGLKQLRNLLIFRCRRRASTSLSSTSRLPRRSVLPPRPHCLDAPTICRIEMPFAAAHESAHGGPELKITAGGGMSAPRVGPDIECDHLERRF